MRAATEQSPRHRVTRVKPIPIAYAEYDVHPDGDRPGPMQVTATPGASASLKAAGGVSIPLPAFRRCALWVLVTLLVPSAHASAGGRDTWREVRAPGVTVSGDVSERDLGRAMGDIQAFRAALSVLYPPSRFPRAATAPRQRLLPSIS